MADLDRFYAFVLRALLGARYAQNRCLQPIGVGALDEPRFKGVDKRSTPARRAPNVFDHAHIVLFVPDAMHRGRSTAGRFAEFGTDGTLQRLWRKLNPESEIHLISCYDRRGALDYGLKTAKLQDVPQDELLIWPVAS